VTMRLSSTVIIKVPRLIHSLVRSIGPNVAWEREPQG
jgi:hypothetical protein